MHRRLPAVEARGRARQLLAKHFNPDWVGWEEKDKALKLRLTAIAPGRIAFGGVVFKREGDDALTVDLTRRGKDGEARTESMRFTRKAR
jgi:hypothetical protein